MSFYFIDSWKGFGNPEGSPDHALRATILNHLSDVKDFSQQQNKIKR